MYRILDVETENTGVDVMKDNKRIISVQIGDATKQDVYWADSANPQWTLGNIKKEIESLLSQGYIFAGYNIKGFDVPLLKEFLGIEIPESNIFDLYETPRVAELRKEKKSRLEDVCAACGVEVTHKYKMNEVAERYKKRQDIKDQACARAKDIVKDKGWSNDFAYRYALDKISGGHAILEAFQEFVKSNEPKKTLFYQYAVGDIISEYNLLKALNY